MANFCRNCGTRLPDGALFCPVCGKQVSGPGPAQTPPPQYANQSQRPSQAPPQYANQSQRPSQAPPQYANQASPKKKRSFLPFAGLAAVMIFAVVAVSGLFGGPGEPGGGTKPGKIIEGGKNGSYANVVDPDENASIAQVDMDRVWLPPEPEDIVLGYSAEEIAKAPETVMQVGPGQTFAESGDFTVDFGDWNLVDEDSFSIRELPVRVHKEEGYYVRGYDFSLASGRTEFYTEVKVTIPRDAKEGEQVMFLTKDPETGKNEEEYFEISEDGKSYVLYTTHFSEHDMVTISDFGKNFSEAVRRGDVTGQETRDALGAFYYPTRVPWNERMTAPVKYSPYDLWSKVMDKYAYLPSSYSLMGAAAEKIRSDPHKTVPIRVDFGGLLLVDEDTLEGMLGDTYTVTDQGNNARGFTVAPAVDVLDKLSLENVSPGIRETIHNSAKSDFFNWVGAATMIIGFQMTNDKAIRELEAGKYDSGSAAFWNNWRDYAGTLVGTIGLVGATMVSTPVSVTAAFGGFALYCISQTYKTPYDDLVGVELNYREYYAGKGFFRRFYFDEPAYANMEYGVNGAVGNIRPLEKTMTPEQNRRLKKLINEDLKKIHGIGGIPGEDTRSKGVNPEWGAAVTFIIGILKDEPEKIGPAVQEFYHNYAQACWDMGDDNFLTFSRAAMEARGEDPNAARLLIDEDDYVTEEALTAILEKELFVKHRGLFLEIARYYEHQSQIEVNKMIRTELVPLLNTPMEFTVEDQSLKKPSEFKKSVFNKALKPTDAGAFYVTENGRYTDFSKNYLSPMNFCVKNQNGEYEHVYRPVFMPGVNYSKNYQEFDNYVVGLSLLKGFYEDYYPAKKNFLPAFTDEKGNVVFRCTYFHYLMMGAPTAMAFRDVDEKNGGEIIAPFEIPERPDSDGKLHVNIQVKPGEGVWELEKLVYESHYHFEPTYRDTSGMTSEERAKELKKHLFEVKYCDRTIQADPDGYVYDDDTRGGMPPRSGPVHSEGKLPGTGGTRDELIKRIRDVGYQIDFKVLPSEGDASSKVDDIPTPKAGGNRRLCIQYNHVVLVYREAGGRTASTSAWVHVDEDSSTYWKREVLGKQ